MGISHKLLLLAILGVIMWLLVAVGRLVRRGLKTGRSEIRWRDMNELRDISANKPDQSLRFPLVSVVKKIVLPLCSFVSFVVKKFLGLIRINSRPALLPLSDETLADPVDGTTFQKGEQVIRCTCGAAYHSHSWQWLSQNNGSRCVTCKQAS